MVCKNCGYNNRDGVEFCRHCGISLKGKKRREVKVRAVKAARREEGAEYSLSPRKIQPKAREEREERQPGSGGNLKTATAAVGMFVIACVIAFCLFAFDLVNLPRSGGNITVITPSALSETPSPEPTPSLTPVPTVAASDINN